MKRNLTKREAILYRMICDDCLIDKQIAFETKRSIHTVRNQKRGLYRKMGVQSVAELSKKYFTEKAPVIQMFPPVAKKAA